MRWNMMNLNNYEENLGKKNLNIFVLIDLKREIREDFVVVLKAKTHILNALLTQHLFDYPKGCIQLNIEQFWKKEDPGSLHNQIDELRLQDKLGKQNFHKNHWLIQVKIPPEI